MIGGLTQRHKDAKAQRANTSGWKKSSQNDAAFFVIHFDGVAVDGVFDANAFGAVLEVADDFVAEVALDASMVCDFITQTFIQMPAAPPLWLRR
jgi:hypothetical protein